MLYYPNSPPPPPHTQCSSHPPPSALFVLAPFPTPCLLTCGLSNPLSHPPSTNPASFVKLMPYLATIAACRATVAWAHEFAVCPNNTSDPGPIRGLGHPLANPFCRMCRAIPHHCLRFLLRCPATLTVATVWGCGAGGGDPVSTEDEPRDIRCQHLPSSCWDNPPSFVGPSPARFLPSCLGSTPPHRLAAHATCATRTP